jgi:nucleoid DNA-binding protein
MAGGKPKVKNGKEFIDLMYRMINHGGVKRFTKESCRIAYHTFIATLIFELEKGRDVPIDGIGDFMLEEVPEAMRLNPKTQKKFLRPAYKKLVFKPKPSLKQLVRDK